MSKKTITRLIYNKEEKYTYVLAKFSYSTAKIKVQMYFVTNENIK